VDLLDPPTGEGPEKPVELTDTGGFGVYVAEGKRYDEVGADLATLTDDIEHQIAEGGRVADLILFAIDVQAGITPRTWRSRRCSASRSWASATRRGSSSRSA
jgi:hypothetical protein